MSVGQWERWCRQAGFKRDHPHPGADLGYDGRDLQVGSLEDVDAEDYDWYWQDPVDEDAWLIVDDETVIDAENHP